MLNLGKKDYLLGSHPFFEVFRAMYRMKNRPYLIGGLLMLLGYVCAAMRRLERSLASDLIALRRADQLLRLRNVLRHPFAEQPMEHVPGRH
jgi:hypothetical protein